MASLEVYKARGLRTRMGQIDTQTKTRDGYLTVHITDNDMKAVADLYPPGPEGKALDLETAMEILKDQNIVWGVDEKTIKEKLLEVNSSGKVQQNVLIAKGEAPQDAVPTFWKLKESLTIQPTIKKAENRIEYRKLSPYTMVKNGEALAEKIPAVPGRTGHNILGQALPMSEKHIVSYTFGENIREKDNILYSMTSGIFEINGTELAIKETLIIENNVDYSTGHIVFPGDIVIQGEIRDGFQVSAKGSIYLHGTMDATQVLSRKDLYVGGGIKGRQQALIRVVGNIETKFIENSRVEAHGGISVVRSIVHSRVFTLEKLEMGDRSVLVGGETWARAGINAWDVGRADGPETIIRVGSDYEIEKKLQHTENHLKRLDERYKHLRSLPPKDKSQKLMQQVEVAMKNMRISQEILAKQLNNNPKATVTIRGKVYIGTELFIMGLSYRVTKEIQAVRFCYDPKDSKIVIRALRHASFL